MEHFEHMTSGNFNQIITTVSHSPLVRIHGKIHVFFIPPAGYQPNLEFINSVLIHVEINIQTQMFLKSFNYWETLVSLLSDH